MVEEFFDRLSTELVKGAVNIRIKYVKDKDKYVVALMRNHSEIVRYYMTEKDVIEVIHTLNKHYIVKYDFIEGITIKVMVKKRY